jgi:hypothetical protein
MRRSAFRHTSAFLILTACGGFDPAELAPPPPDDAQAGLAGFSFDAGAPAAGRSASTPRGGSDDDWVVEGGAGTSDGDDTGGSASANPHERDGEAGSAESTGGRPDGAAGAPDVTGSGGRGAGGVPGGAAGTPAGQGGTSGTVASAGHGGRASSGGANTAGRASDPGGASATSGAGGAGEAGGAGAEAGTAGTGGTAPVAPGTLFFSEYVEGSSSYKALELFAMVRVSLSGCELQTYSNGAPAPSSHIELEGELEAGEVSVLCTSSLAELGAACNRSVNLNFNGNDAIALACGGVLLDAIGVFGADPGTAWEGGGASTLNQTLRRRCASVPDVDGTDAFDPSVQWLALPTDTFAGLGDPACAE